MVASLNSEVQKLIRREKGTRLRLELNRRGIVCVNGIDNHKICLIGVKHIKIKYNIDTETLYFPDRKYTIPLDDVPEEIERYQKNPIKTISGGEWYYFRNKDGAIYHDFVSGLVLGLTSDSFYTYASVLQKENTKYTFLKTLYKTEEILSMVENNYFEDSERKKTRELLKLNNIEYREIDGDFWFNNTSYSYNPKTRTITEFKTPSQYLHYKMPFKEFLLQRILRPWKQPYKNYLEKYVS